MVDGACGLDIEEDGDVELKVDSTFALEEFSSPTIGDWPTIGDLVTIGLKIELFAVGGVAEFVDEVKEGSEPVFGFPKLNMLEVAGVAVCEKFGFGCVSAVFGAD